MFVQQREDLEETQCVFCDKMAPAAPFDYSLPLFQMLLLPQQEQFLQSKGERLAFSSKEQLLFSNKELPPFLRLLVPNIKTLAQYETM